MPDSTMDPLDLLAYSDYGNDDTLHIIPEQLDASKTLCQDGREKDQLISQKPGSRFARVRPRVATTNPHVLFSALPSI